MGNYTRIKLLLFAGWLTYWPVPALAQSSPNTPVEHAIAPGGKVTYYIMSVPEKDSKEHPYLELEAGNNYNASFSVLLTPKPSDEPKQNLDDFSGLFLSPDGKTLYFHTSAWVTSAAIHSLDIATNKVSYVTDGNIVCVVSEGYYQGDLVVHQHKYFVQGGSYDNLYLYDPAGRQIGLVSQDENADSLEKCHAVEQF